jgi:hypothetical protein
MGAIDVIRKKLQERSTIDESKVDEIVDEENKMIN